MTKIVRWVNRTKTPTETRAVVGTNPPDNSGVWEFDGEFHTHNLLYDNIAYTFRDHYEEDLATRKLDAAVYCEGRAQKDVDDADRNEVLPEDGQEGPTPGGDSEEHLPER